MASRVPSRKEVLVVDADQGTRETTKLACRQLGLHSREAANGGAAIAACRAQRFDLALIDFRLPDMSGLDVIMRLKEEGICYPFVLVSGWMTVSIAVQAMRLGALDAVLRPVDIQHTVISALRELSIDTTHGWPKPPVGGRLSKPKSTVDRVVSLMLRGCDATADLRTLSDWASCACVSYTGVAELCRLVGISPHNARDFVRVARSLVHNSGRADSLPLTLDVSDHRTLRRLLKRAGFDPGSLARSVTPREFIDHQEFVSRSHEVMIQLATILSTP